MAEKTRAKKGDAGTLVAAPFAVAYPAKVQPPMRRPAIVRRERLIQSLSEAAERRVAVVTAPAGYGKTTLLLDFAQASPLPVCWYSLDERDADPQTFLRYFVAAGRTHFPDFGEELAAALEAGEPLNAKQMTDLMVLAMASAGTPFVFILDDFHFLDDAPGELREALDGWVYRLPPEAHVVLAGRTRPQLSVLPMMTVRQEVAVVTASDFSFTCEEVVQLFRDVLGKDITLDDSQHLADLTEGWAAALVLLAENFGPKLGSVSLEQLRGSDTIFQYISLEQFQPLPDDLREFLTGSAVLRAMDPDTVNQLLDIRDTEERMNVLSRLNLFVKPDEAHSDGFRYHKLFRSFLVSHLRANQPQRFTELNLKAAALQEQLHHWEDAVYHYIQAGAWEKIVQITDKLGARLFEEGKWDTLAEWLEAIPNDALAAQPKLLLWKARTIHRLNQVDRALAVISQAIDVLETAGDTTGLAEALMTKGVVLRMKGDYEDSRTALARARTLLKGDGHEQLLTEVRKELGITLARCGDLAQSIKELSAVTDIYEAQGDEYNIAHASNELACSLGMAGRISEAAGYLERARQLWMALGNDHLLVQTLDNLGMIYYLHGDMEKAVEIYEQGLERVRPLGNVREELYLKTSLADVKRDMGQLQAALDTYRSALDESWTTNDAYITVYLMDAIANTHRLMGDIGNAESWASRAMAEAEKTGGALELGLCLMTAGLVKRQQEQPKEAIDNLEKAVPYLKEKGAHRELCTAYFHLAGIYFSLNKKRLALDMLELCAKLVKDLGYDHFLMVEAARNPLLVQYGSANKLADGYYQRMLKLIKSSAGGNTESAAEQAAEDAATTATIQAFGFGHPRVEMRGREITDLEWRSEKSKEMFFFFLCNRRPLRKEEIVTALWPDMPEEKTTSAFHSNMYRLRKALYQEVIAKDSGRYVLDPQGSIAFDVEQYQDALGKADAGKGTPEAIAHMERAHSVYKGQFAPDFYSEWAETLRWQMEEQHMSVMGSLAAAYNEAGEYKKSADVCQQIIEVDEFNEAAWYRLMSNYIQSGQTEAAKYCYNRYVQIITKDEMDEEDVPEFDDLVREINAGKLRV